MSEKWPGWPRQRAQGRLRRKYRDGADEVTESPLSAITIKLMKKRPSTALPSLYIDDVPHLFVLHVKFQALCI